MHPFSAIALVSPTSTLATRMMSRVEGSIEIAPKVQHIIHFSSSRHPTSNAFTDQLVVDSVILDHSDRDEYLTPGNEWCPSAVF